MNARMWRLLGLQKLPLYAHVVCKAGFTKALFAVHIRPSSVLAQVLSQANVPRPGVAYEMCVDSLSSFERTMATGRSGRRSAPAFKLASLLRAAYRAFVGRLIL